MKDSLLLLSPLFPTLLLDSPTALLCRSKETGKKWEDGQQKQRDKITTKLKAVTRKGPAVRERKMRLSIRPTHTYKHSCLYAKGLFLEVMDFACLSHPNLQRPYHVRR